MTTINDTEAREIAETLLERTGDAMMADDFNGFAACIAVPLKLETLEGKKVIKSTEDLREVFDSVCDYYRKQGVTELVRVIADAQSPSEDEIQSTHQCLVISGKILIESSYQCFSRINRFGDDWKITQSKYTISDNPDHVAALLCESAK